MHALSRASREDVPAVEPHHGPRRETPRAHREPPDRPWQDGCAVSTAVTTRRGTRPLGAP